MVNYLTDGAIKIVKQSFIKKEKNYGERVHYSFSEVCMRL